MNKIKNELSKTTNRNELKMSKKVKALDIKNRTYYFFNDIVIIENFDPNNIKIDEKHIKIFLFTTLDM